MITGPVAHFISRCHERGYTLGEVAGCIVSTDGKTITVDESHPEYPRHPKSPDAGPPPTLLQKAKNFATAAAKHLAAGMPLATEEELARRFAICQACEFLKDSACLKCGCPVKREKAYLSKLAWADQSCPVGKWGPEDTGK